MTKIIDFPVKNHAQDKRERMVFELNRIASLIKNDEADPQVEYLLVTFKQGKDIIVGGVGAVPGEDRKEVCAAMEEGFKKWEREAEITTI